MCTESVSRKFRARIRPYLTVCGPDIRGSGVVFVYICGCSVLNVSPSCVMWLRHSCSCQSRPMMQGKLGNIPVMTNSCYSDLYTGLQHRNCSWIVSYKHTWCHCYHQNTRGDSWHAVLLSLSVRPSFCGVFQVIANTAATSVPPRFLLNLLNVHGKCIRGAGISFF